MNPEVTENVSKEEEPFGLGCALEYFSEMSEVLEMIDNLKTLITAPQSHKERACERLTYILGQYIEQPHLLDAHIDEILTKLIVIVRNTSNEIELKHAAFKYMFILINVRGYKVIVSHLPHEVSDFEPVLRLLETQDPNDAETWTTRYVLLLWMSIIVMIPFHMSRLDGFDASDTTQISVMSRVLDVCKKYAVVPDKCRDAAAFLTARFLTRYDVKEQHLSGFFDWVCEQSTDPNSNIFVKYGTLACVATILKHGKREDLLPFADRLLEWIINAEFKNNSGANIQKLAFKIIQRIGMTFLPPRVAAWRYQRGNRSLAANLSAGDGEKKPPIGNNTSTHDESPEDVNVPDEIEEIIDQLIQGLGCADGVVRWSAAKGVGRITSRLPKELADDVVGSVLEIFTRRERDAAWHGGCLALAELGRRGLLLPQRLPEVVPVVLKALVYDEPRGYASVGSHIRDAACYVCWSFARAYETDVLKPFVNDIASTLLIVACFDKEINCRRAASAAFQENVGRQGTFPHGIDILTTADFFAVSVRSNAYLIISVYIAQFPEYTLPLIDHLITRKVDHWDTAIRELTAKALHNLTAKAPDYMVATALPQLFLKTATIDLNNRHGAILAIGEIILALSKLGESVSSSVADLIGVTLLEKCEKLISVYQERHFFRGMGGEMMRQAFSSYIENCSLAHVPFHGKEVIELWFQLLNDCLSYDVPHIRTCAINALPAFLSEYFQAPDADTKRLAIIQSYVDKLALKDNEVVRMGHSLALGVLPKFMLRMSLSSIIGALVGAMEITAPTLKWAEGRRDCVKAITGICGTLAEDISTDFTEETIESIYKRFLDGLKEYTQDNRGDIGAWVREACMTGLQSLTHILAKNWPQLLHEPRVTSVVTGVAQQAVEKIDRTRAVAGRVFYSFIHSDPEIVNIPQHKELKKIFPKSECDLLNWNSAADTFPRFVQLVEFPAFTYSVTLGLVCSVGGMTETLVKNSSASLFTYLKVLTQKKGDAEIKRITEIVYQVFFDHQKVDRITVPMFRFLDKLMCSGCINSVMYDPESEFPKKILKLIQLEIVGCKDIYKLIDGINVMCQFIQIKSEVCSTALVQLSILLCHRQSYVRRSTSNRLYESLLVYGDSSVIPVENLDEVMNLLSCTDWEEAVDVVKPVRNNLCNLMAIRVPVPKKKT